MKRILFLAAVVVAGTVVAGGLDVIYLVWFAGATAPPATVVDSAPVKIRPLPDADALSRRMLSEQPVYRQLRDETLAAYAKAHPGTHPFDEEARETLKLASYLWVWDDYYGEGLWRVLDGHCKHLQGVCPDQIWLSLEDLVWGPHANSNSEAAVNEVNACENRLGASGYPVAFKFAAYEMAMVNMIGAKNDDRIKPPLVSSLAALPDITTKAAGAYRQLIAEHLPAEILYAKGRELIGGADDDNATLILVSRQLDQAFNLEDPHDAIADVLDALSFIDQGCQARGGGYSNTVTAQGWKIFGQSMQHAGAIDLAVYARSPHTPGLARGMMTVIQGLQMPRDQMELWFQRGLATDPNDFTLYQLKEYFLLPRWYGSEEDEWNFATTCVQGGNWAAKIPLILVDELTYREQGDSKIYTLPEIWGPTESVFREFLWRYPASVHYRSLFALDAAKGEHWQVAKEQFKILGKDWDPDVFDDDNPYPRVLHEVNAH